MIRLYIVFLLVSLSVESLEACPDGFFGHICQTLTR